jgi:hypothetical protein
MAKKSGPNDARLATAYRKKSDQLLTEDESDLSTIESVLRMTTRV